MNMPISKAELKKMQSSADDACKLMKVLSNRDRMMLLCEIGQAEKCVGELETALDLHQPTLSRQLLKHAVKRAWTQSNCIAEDVLAAMSQHSLKLQDRKSVV